MTNAERAVRVLEQAVEETLSSQQELVFVDYVSARINQVHNPEQVVTYLKWLLASSGILISDQKASLPQGYQWSYLLQDSRVRGRNCGAIKYSAEYSRIIFELTGFGADLVRHRDSSQKVMSFLAQSHVDIRRIDIAYDDYLGDFPIEMVDKKYSRGHFNPVSGKRPVKRNIGDIQNGRTRYIGGKQAYKQVCIYEKGKQKQSNRFPNWIRHELRFKSNSRDQIPKEVLNHLTQYFLSAYPRAYKSLSPTMQYCSVVRRRTRFYAHTVKKRIGNIKHQYGPSLLSLREILPDGELLDKLVRQGSSTALTPSMLVSKAMLIEELSAELKGARD